MAAELTSNRDDAVWERVHDAEKRLDDARVRVHRTRAERHTREAERQWRRELYNQAFESYTAAREEYERARDVARDRELSAVADLVEEIDAVRHNIDHLSKSPLRRAEEARDRADRADSPAVAADRWEDALEKYQTALVLDWGSDERRFAGDSDEIRSEIETVVDRLVTVRRELATRHRQTGNWYHGSGDYERAGERYARAKHQLEAALSVARELRPGAVDDLEADLASLDSRLDTVREEAPRGAFESVDGEGGAGDGRREAGEGVADLD